MTSEAFEPSENEAPEPAPEREPKLHIGDTVPDFELRAGPRKKATLSSFWGERPLALVFLHALDTPFAIEVAVQWRDGGAPVEKAGGAIVGISNARPYDMEAFRERWNLTYPLLSDPSSAAYKAFDVTPELPGSFVIDPAGALRYAHRNGAALDNPPTWDLADAIAEITGKKLDRPESKVLPPIGAPIVGVGPRGKAAAGSYTCAKCGNADYDVLDVSTASGMLSRLFNFQNRRFSAVVCRKCRYSELYQADSSKLRNAVDLLLGS
ncbi:MAG: zinc ribbon domain-containing protein [Dehalococcoidia bacterium]